MKYLVRKNIFDILREAEEDEDNQDETNTDTSETQDDTDAASDEPEVPDDDYGDNEDFNIDTSLDEDPESEDTGSDDTGTDSSIDTSDSSSSTDTVSDDEPVQANTDIFNSLSQEEQAIKIKELKSMYRDLYCSCDDLLVKIDDIEQEEDNIETISRVSMVMYTLKQYIADYLTNLFSIKSYIENDIAFNRFLSILNSVSIVIEDISKQKEQKIGKTDKNK